MEISALRALESYSSHDTQNPPHSAGGVSEQFQVRDGPAEALPGPDAVPDALRMRDDDPELERHVAAHAIDQRRDFAAQELCGELGRAYCNAWCCEGTNELDHSLMGLVASSFCAFYCCICK